jgi:hypothetical protein
MTSITSKCILRRISIRLMILLSLRSPKVSYSVVRMPTTRTIDSERVKTQNHEAKASSIISVFGRVFSEPGISLFDEKSDFMISLYNYSKHRHLHGCRHDFIQRYSSHR